MPSFKADYEGLKNEYTFDTTKTKTLAFSSRESTYLEVAAMISNQTLLLNKQNTGKILLQNLLLKVAIF